MYTERLYRINQVCEITGIKPSTIYKLIREGNFPPPIKINRSSSWSSHSVQEWMANKCNPAKGKDGVNHG